MISPKFPEPERETLLQKLAKLPVAGKPERSSKSVVCISCGRSTYPVGRVLWDGAVVCCERPCEYTGLPNISGLFPTPYGNAMNQHVLRIFAKSIEGNRILIQIQPVERYATILVDGYLDLLAWQRAYHDYERLTHPDAYSRGAVSIAPPRKLDEVMVFRSLIPPSRINPTRNLEPSVREVIQNIYENGSESVEIPF